MLTESSFVSYLKPWVVYAQKYLYQMKDRPDLMCFGVGANAGGNSWGMQTNQKGMASFIVAGYSKEIDWSDTDLTAEMVRQQGLAMLRFTLASHVTGEYHCTDGRNWGHNWISTLGTARMMHALNIAWNDLTEEDHSAVRRVLISEADWLLNEYPVKAGLVEDNHPESNIWNGALLYQTACLYPDAPNAAAYKQKATKFIVNGISVPSDSRNVLMYDGVAVKDVFVGANMFETMACNHHSYMNLGYMVICLSNLAMLYFWCRDWGFPLPQSFDHHVLELWKLIRNCTFEDGRLWRIGGDTRVRYCYCQDYALPMWALMSEKYGEDCQNLMEGWLAQIDREVANNGDGSFLSDRLSYMLDMTPYYYTRLESDRACTLSMLGYWKSKYPIAGKKKPEAMNEWYDEYHGSIMQKSNRRKTCFTWLAGQRPTAMCIPAEESTLAEWQQNMTGKVSSFGAMNEDRIIKHKELPFAGGYLTFGQSASESRRFYCEGYRMDTPAIKTLAYAALPDDATVVCLQHAVSPIRIFAKDYASLMLHIPNDVYNNNKRKYDCQNGNFELAGGRFGQQQDQKIGSWLNVDGKMGVAAADALTLRSPKFRQIDIIVNDIQDSNRDGYGTLYCNDVVMDYSDTPQWFNPGDEIYRCGFAVNIGDAKQTQQMAESIKTYSTENQNLTGIYVTGQDGREYLMILNVGKEKIDVQIPNGFALFSGNNRLAEGEALLARR